MDNITFIFFSINIEIFKILILFFDILEAVAQIYFHKSFEMYLLNSRNIMFYLANFWAIQACYAFLLYLVDRNFKDVYCELYFYCKPLGILITMFLYFKDFYRTYEVRECRQFNHFLTIMFLLSFLHFLLYAELYNKLIDLRKKKKKKAYSSKSYSFGEEIESN